MYPSRPPNNNNYSQNYSQTPATPPKTGGASDKFLIVGLGNPGRDYRLNRHNVGFMMVDHIVDRYQWTPFTRKQGRALYTTGLINGKDVMLVKPQTFMNASGEAVAAFVRFYDIPLKQVLVCCDDMQLPLGTVRLRPRGTAGGQKGLQSIVMQLGSDLFPRLRIGVGLPAGPNSHAKYVLQDFKDDEIDVIELALDKSVDAIETFIAEGAVLAMSRFNGPATVPASLPTKPKPVTAAPQPPKPAPKPVDDYDYDDDEDSLNR